MAAFKVARDFASWPVGAKKRRPPTAPTSAFRGHGCRGLTAAEAAQARILACRRIGRDSLRGVILARSPFASYCWRMKPFATETVKATGLTELQRSLELDRIYRKGCLPVSACRRDSGQFRVLSWNIERGHAPARIAETITRLRPDVACLQEVDWGNERTGRRDVLEFLAERTGMLGLFGIEFLELNSSRRSPKFAGGGATGNALLTKLEPVSSFRVELPPSLDWSRAAEDRNVPGSVRWRVRRQPRLGARFGIGAELAMGGRNLFVCSLHLEDKLGGVRGRWAQYVASVRAVEARRGAAMGVIAGDFNTFDCRLARFVTPDGKATAHGKPASVTEADWWQGTLLPSIGYADPFTSAEWTFCVPPLFRSKLDWITIKGAEVQSRGIGPFSSSDHRPIWADLDTESC